MPDTLNREEIAAIRERVDGRKVYGDMYAHAAESDRKRLLAHIDALTAAVEALTLYDENARTMADAAESMRNRAVAIIRGEHSDPDAEAEAEFLKSIKPT